MTKKITLISLALLVILIMIFKSPNDIITKLAYASNKAYGRSYKFIIAIDNYDFETDAPSNEDRVSKCKINLHVDAFLIPEDTGNKTNQQKTYSIRSMVINSETVVNIDDVPTI